MKIKLIAFSAMAMAMSSTVFAGSNQSVTNQAYLSVGDSSLESSSPSIDGDLIEIGIKKSIEGDLYFHTNYAQYKFERNGAEVTLDKFKLNLGKSIPLTYGTNIMLEGGMEGARLDYAGVSEYDHYNPNLSIGVHSFIAPDLETYAVGQYTFAKDNFDYYVATIGVNYYLNKNFSLGAKFEDLGLVDTQENGSDFNVQTFSVVGAYSF